MVVASLRHRGHWSGARGFSSGFGSAGGAAGGVDGGGVSGGGDSAKLTVTSRGKEHLLYVLFPL